MAITINATTRTDLGKGASRRLRLTEHMPAIVYGSGDPASLVIDQREIRPYVNEEVFYASIVDLVIDGKKAEKVIVRDVQHHPFKLDLAHMDFQRVDAKKKMHMHVHLHFVGEETCPGVKIGGGLVSHVINEVEVICLPKDIPEFIDVDVSGVNVGETVHLTDLVMPKGVELAALSHGDEVHDTTVFSIHAPKVAVVEDDTTAETPAAEE